MKLFVTAISVVICACASTDGPRAAVHTFYTSYLKVRPAGLPEGADLERMKPLLSRRLHGLIVDALQYRDAYIAGHAADEKPPFVDGDHFTSLFEGPKSFEVARAVAEPNGSWKVHVRFSRDSARWEDAVLVIKEDGRYVIDDVLFSGAGEFNPSGRLSEQLTWREED
ncbi:MAG TPA: DUF3828 domain-containing protein [Thermoanaerobaculia bacterium]|nr:DUF3828 domain-containing protein [Thermoanaerobaculia bacterium]